MSRRAGIAIALVVVLIAGRLLVSRGLHPVSAARSHVNQPAFPDGASGATAPASEVSTTALPVSEGSGHVAAPPETEKTRADTAEPRSEALQTGGVTDVDPHKAFGSKSAPIVMETFSDYQCPSCKALFENTNRQLMDNYVSTGKVYLIHRDFPLPMHAYSRVAARYARAAADIGKVEPVEKTLYDNQEKWEQTGDIDGTVAAVLTPAEMTKVREIVKRGTVDPLIEKDMQLGQMYRVNQTPTTVFHTKGQTYPYSGAMSWDTLRQFLDQLLSQK